MCAYLMIEEKLQHETQALSIGGWDCLSPKSSGRVKAFCGYALLEGVVTAVYQVITTCGRPPCRHHATPYAGAASCRLMCSDPHGQ